MALLPRLKPGDTRRILAGRDPPYAKVDTQRTFYKDGIKHDNTAQYCTGYR